MRLALPRDGVVFIPAGKACQANGGLVRQCRQQFAHHDMGIESAFVNILPGVPAAKPAKRQREAGAVGFRGFHRQRKVMPHSAATADNHFPLAGGIQIDHPPRAHVRIVKPRSAEQPDLLRSGEKTFQRRGGKRVVRQGVQNQRHAETVIRAERGARRVQNIPLKHQFDPLGGKIVLHTGVLFRHHIGVRLQEHRGLRFSAPAGFLFQKNVMVRVRVRRKPHGFAERHQVCRHPCLIARGTRNSRNFFKIIQRCFGIHHFSPFQSKRAGGKPPRP